MLYKRTLKGQLGLCSVVGAKGLKSFATMGFITAVICFGLYASVQSKENPCSELQFSCDDGTSCIERTRWCDEAIDCKDSSDERYCNEASNCQEHHFRCHNGSCIPISGRCDGISDCRDKSDELCAESEHFASTKQLPVDELDFITSGYDVDASGYTPISLATEWLMKQRYLSNGWGSESPRAIIALALSGELLNLHEDEYIVIEKQLNTMLTVELMNRDSPRISIGRLASYVLALYATCQNPTNFQGVNLVEKLRATANEGIGSRFFNQPFTLLTLCIAGRPEDHDYQLLRKIYARKSYASFGSRALAIMGMTCLINQDKYQTYSRHFSDSLQRFVDEYAEFEDSLDVYSKALAFQAINCGDRITQYKTLNVSSLLKHQTIDGSFGDVLATYYAIPAIAEKCLINLTAMCHSLHEDVSFDTYPVVHKPATVQLSLWIGKDPVFDSHTISVEFTGNMSLYEVMKMAEKRNSIFRFHHDESDAGKTVYSIGDIPNDAERELYWTLHVNKKDKELMVDHAYNLAPAATGVDRLYPEHGDHYVFWLKTNEQS